ncbi:uncharacterized protein LOC118150612 isoform X2 [Callithrix jacchus]
MFPIQPAELLLKILYHSLLVCKVSAEKFTDNLINSPVYVETSYLRNENLHLWEKKYVLDLLQNKPGCRVYGQEEGNDPLGNRVPVIAQQNRIEDLKSEFLCTKDILP